MAKRQKPSAKPQTSPKPQDCASADQTIIRAAFGCGDSLAQTIEAMCFKAAAAAGKILYPCGETAETILLLHGRARDIAYGRNGGVVVLHNLEAGEFYGAWMALGGALSPAQVESVTATRSGHFDATSLVRLMESYSCVALAVSMQLAQRLEKMRNRMAETVLLSATGRICAELSRMAEAAPGRTIHPIPVFTEMAVMAQTTRETVSRTISSLEKRGIFLRDADGLHLTAPHRLQEMIY